MSATLNVTISPIELIFLLEAGLIYRDAGKYQEAKEIFQGVMVLRPDSDIPLVSLGTTLFVEGKIDEAIDNYRLALEKQPESAFAYAHLGEALFMKKDFDMARDSLAHAIELDEHGPYGELARSILEIIA